MAKIHPLSVVDPQAQLADDVTVGPFCVIGPEVFIGSGTVLISHVSISGKTTIGKKNRFFPFASIGGEPQDKKYAGENTSLVIGDENVFRENVTVSLGTVQDHGITRIGSKNLFMANSHVAHDCEVGDECILANSVGIAGHCHIGSHVVIGGISGVHQFCRIGSFAMVGGGSVLTMDVPPYVLCNGNLAEPHGINIVGLKRFGYDLKAIGIFKEIYKILYRESLTLKESMQVLKKLNTEHPDFSTEILLVLDFLEHSERGIIRPKG